MTKKHDNEKPINRRNPRFQMSEADRAVVATLLRQTRDEAERRVGEWTAAGGIIAVHWATEKDLIVSVIVGDDLAGALLWHRYPESDRDAAWASVASFDRSGHE